MKAGVDVKTGLRAIALVGVMALSSACIGSSQGGVALLGDSITSLASINLKERLLGTDQIHDHAVWGIRVDEQLDTAKGIAKDRPDQVMLNLGTNDVTQGRDTQAVLDDYATILDTLDQIQCVHVITLNEHMRGDTALGAKAAQINVGIRELAAQHDNTTVTEWSAIFAYPADNSLLMDDLLHPNEEGSKKLGGAMALLAKACDTSAADE